jgi:hypothetical protein
MSHNTTTRSASTISSSMNTTYDDAAPRDRTGHTAAAMSRSSVASDSAFSLRARTAVDVPSSPLPDGPDVLVTDVSLPVFPDDPVAAESPHRVSHSCRSVDTLGPTVRGSGENCGA